MPHLLPELRRLVPLLLLCCPVHAPPRRPAPLPSGPSASRQGPPTSTQPFALAPGRPLLWGQGRLPGTAASLPASPAQCGGRWVHRGA